MRRASPVRILQAAGFAAALLVAQAALAEVPSSADAVVDRYFDALRSGDVYDLSNLLGGRLKVKRQALLDNPDYGSYLAAENGDWAFRVVDEREADGGLIEVDYVMTLGDSERIRKRLYLAPAPDPNQSYQIVEERVLP